MPDTWESLNKRQQAYLQALYDTDQAEETWRRMAAAGGHWSRQPASEWRWLMYGPVAPPTALYAALKHQKLIDPGTGATWKALEDRKLCQTQNIDDGYGGTLLKVKITPLGRKLVRSATGEQRPKPLPKGTLRERQWAALVRLYGAGDAGIDNDTLLYARGGFDWYKTLRRLADYTPQPLIAYRAHPSPVYHITQAGITFYIQNWTHYRALYPDLEAPEPPQA